MYRAQMTTENGLVVSQAYPTVRKASEWMRTFAIGAPVGTTVELVEVSKKVCRIDWIEVTAEEKAALLALAVRRKQKREASERCRKSTAKAHLADLKCGGLCLSGGATCSCHCGGSCHGMGVCEPANHVKADSHCHR